MASVLKSLFRPDVLQPHLRAIEFPPDWEEKREILTRWSAFLASREAREHTERNLLPDFLTEIFLNILGYRGPVSGEERYNFRREQNIEVDGKAADAVIGHFGPEGQASRFVVAVEGKGPRDPLDRPHGGRKKSAVEQGYGYAINLPCDWIIVTSMRETRLYHKLADQFTCERFDIHRLAREERQQRKFLFLLHADRIVPATGECHLHELHRASERAGKALTKAFYQHYADIRHEAYLRLAQANPDRDRKAVLALTQKLLDRVLFCAFAEDRELLPAESLESAFHHRDPYNPRPVWENFRGLFHAINTGNKQLNIPQYNGGLFAEDPDLDSLIVPDEICEFFKQIGDYEYRAPEDADADEVDPSERGIVDVAILGHIFEQSITDLERLRAEVEGQVEAEDLSAHRQRRKREGAFYTPDYITRFIVAHTLAPTLRERLEELRRRHHAAAKASAKEALESPEAYDLDALNKPQREALIAFWEDWRGELGRFRILDPAAGSGAFLIEAFDQLFAAYQSANQRLEELRGGVPELLDLNREILQNNLYGVDLSEEAGEICRLSLWIKTAERGKVLSSLAHTIRTGNSVIADPAFDPRALDWEAAFPEVFAEGGFDVVIGNPPYIRQEWLAPLKPHFENQYRAHSGSADLYLYFFERALSLLRPGGRLGFITSGTFARGNFAVPFRQWLPTAAAYEALINFGENQPFEGAEMVYPTISILRKTEEPAPFPTLFIGGTTIPDSLETEFSDSALLCDPEVLAEPEWRFQPRETAALFAKIMEGHTPLGDLFGKGMYRGVLTGCNEAFIIDRATRDRLIAEDGSSEAILKKLLRGEDLRPWYQEDEDRWLIFTRRGLEIDDYPAVKRYLEDFREKLEPRPPDWERPPADWPGRKPGAYEWYEIQDSVDYWAEFESSKIFWPDIQKLPRFSWDDAGLYVNDKGFILRSDGPWILALLQSRVQWFCLSQICTPLRLRGGLWQYQCKKQFVDRLPVPELSDGDRCDLNRLAEHATETARQRFAFAESIRHRLLTDLGPAEARLNTKLQSWWELDFPTLRTEVKKAFKREIPVRERAQWEEALRDWKADFTRQTDALIETETEINDRVYRLFGLTRDDIRLLENHAEQTSTLYPLGAV